MRETWLGSGIFQKSVSFSSFTCEDPECNYQNEADETTTDDWGNYEVVCIQCGWLYYESNVKEEDSND